MENLVAKLDHLEKRELSRKWKGFFSQKQDTSMKKKKMSEGSKLSPPLPVYRERGRFTGVEKEKPLTKVVWPKEFWEAETIV